MITGRIINDMSDEEFDKYLEDRKKVKPYLERYARENMNNKNNEFFMTTGGFERWMKIEIREEKLKELGI